MKTMEQIPVPHQVLTDKKILSRIFDYASETSDLLNFRIVCKTWNSVGSTLLRKRNSCEIILKEEGMRCSTFCSRRPPATLNLRSLNTILSTTSSCDKFPCQNFKFLSGKLDGASELERLFQLYGPQMREFNITRFCQVTPHFFRLIFKYAQNLLVLQIHSFSEIIDGEENVHSRGQNKLYPSPIVAFQNLEEEQIIFHDLHTLEFELPFSTKAEIVLSAILRSAVNLKIVKGLNMKFISVVCKHKKIHLIKELMFNPSDNNVHLFHQFSMENPKLSKLFIKFARIYPEQKSQGHEMITISLNDILESSKWTLRYLDIAPLCSAPGVQIPTLRNVKCLVLRENRRCYPDLKTQLIPKAIFPTSTILQHRFPNLHTVCLYLKEYDASNLNAYFPDDSYNEDIFGIQVNNPFLTVKKLDVDLFIPNSFGVRALARKFPNVKNIRIACGDAYQLNNSIWEFPLVVESIELHGIYVNGSRPADQAKTNPEVSGWMDSVFTGIPQDVCRTFRRFPRTMKDNQLVEMLREKPSICRMKNLRHLRIFIQGWNSPFFTNVSSDYAFKMLPKLKVCLAHDHKKWNCVPNKDCGKLLEDVLPFVEIIPYTESVPFCAEYMSS